MLMVSSLPHGSAGSRGHFEWSTVGTVLFAVFMVLVLLWFIMMFPVDTACSEMKEQLHALERPGGRHIPVDCYRRVIRAGTDYSAILPLYPWKRPGILSMLAEARIKLARLYASQGLTLAAATVAQDYLDTCPRGTHRETAKQIVQGAAAAGFGDRQMQAARALRFTVLEADSEVVARHRNSNDWEATASCELYNGNEFAVANVRYVWQAGRHGAWGRGTVEAVGAGASVAFRLSYRARTGSIAGHVGLYDIDLAPVKLTVSAGSQSAGG